MSRDINGNPIAAVATVVKPMVPFGGGQVSKRSYPKLLISRCRAIPQRCRTLFH